MIYILKGNNGGILRESATQLSEQKGLVILPMYTTLEKRVYDKDDEFMKYISPQKMYDIKKSSSLLAHEKVSRLYETYENAWIFDSDGRDSVVYLLSDHAINMAINRCEKKGIRYLVADISDEITVNT